MRKQKEEDYMSGNLTAMIDVVFQLIIFFVCTVNLQNTVDYSIELAIAPHGKPEDKKDPREVKIDIDEKGRITIQKIRLTPSELNAMVKKIVGDYGLDVPIIIRGDGRAKHSAIETAMNACTSAGIYKIKFSVLKEKGN